ncbi:tRNA pseudouridine(55) synthase TruB [Candidatus Uhrbacteria bacterium]|nr:tRNA pseudouridine(55) synthase TruB [Candidatus Uhrbacteria bacterium]
MSSSILLINKPPGPTSHDIVNMVRKKTGIRRVGHAGTLDPFAEGLLIILVGRDATKRQAEFLGMDKTYEAVIRLGATSTTEDCTGVIIVSEDPRFHGDESELDPGLRRDDNLRQCTLTDIKKVVCSFIGTYDQMPSAYSAKKINGKKAYELARAGIQPDLKPKKIIIRSIDILIYEWPLLTIRCSVSSGTYIRALARDIGEKLGVGAYVEKLKRTTIGPYSLDDAQMPPNQQNQFPNQFS